MKQAKSVVASSYDASTEEVQGLIVKWTKAIEAFHYRFARLDKTIKTLEMTARQQSTTNRTILRRLLELRKYSTDALMTLLLDMDMSGQRSERSGQPSKPGQLHSHACLLDDLNRRIDAELISITTVAQA